MPLHKIFIMIMASILKPLLLLLRYPRLHNNKAVSSSGPHEQIGAHILRIPDSTACQVFYPAEPPPSSKSSKSKSFAPYFRQEAIDGVAHFMNSSKHKSLLRYLNARRHPCHVNATPKQTAKTTSSSDDTYGTTPSTSAPFPVVIFSHGLGGCLEMYTQLCRTLASHGFIVYAMEHEDGSGSYAQKADGEQIYYTRPDSTPYSREKVLKLRGPMYEKRVGEITRLLEYLYSYRVPDDDDDDAIKGDGDGDEYNALLKTNTNNEVDDPILAKLMAVSNLSNGVSLLGHSFGGTTMALAQQRLSSTTTTTFKSTSTTTTAKSTAPIINSVAVLDPWCFSLPDKSLNQGVTSAPLLGILSANWDKGPEFAQVKTLFQNSNIHSSSSSSSSSTLFQSPRGVHQSFSDTYCWLPGFVGKRMGMRGREEALHEVCWASAEVCGEFFKREVGRSARGGDGGVEEGEDGVGISCGDALGPFSVS